MGNINCKNCTCESKSEKDKTEFEFKGPEIIASSNSRYFINPELSQNQNKIVENIMQTNHFGSTEPQNKKTKSKYDLSNDFEDNNEIEEPLPEVLDKDKIFNSPKNMKTSSVYNKSQSSLINSVKMPSNDKNISLCYSESVRKSKRVNNVNSAVTNGKDSETKINLDGLVDDLAYKRDPEIANKTIKVYTRKNSSKNFMTKNGFTDKKRGLTDKKQYKSNSVVKNGNALRVIDASSHNINTHNQSSSEYMKEDINENKPMLNIENIKNGLNVLYNDNKININEINLKQSPEKRNIYYGTICTESVSSQIQLENTIAKKLLPDFQVDKIQFGIPKTDLGNLNKEEQELYEKANKNLSQFFPPEKKDVKQLQKKMSKISWGTLLPLNKIKKKETEKGTLIFNSNLKKMINYEINAHKTTMYSERFCVLYPKVLKYYKSKEQFLKNLKPLCVVPLSQITRVNFAKVNKESKKIDHIILCNKLGIQRQKRSNELFEKMFDTVEANHYLKSPETNESLLIFTSDNEDLIYKWYILFQYLLEKINEETDNNI